MRTVTNQQGGGRHPRSAQNAEVVSITDAGAAHSDEIRSRMIKYAVAMGIRMVCLGLLFVLDGWFKLIAVAGAVFLPWFAVIIANGGDKAETPSDHLIGTPLQAALPAEATEPGDGISEDTASSPGDDGDAGLIIQGEIVEQSPSAEPSAHPKPHPGDAA
ncbi:hypothetical protein QFZ52_001563 [Arthrobacter woluwensis]|uniref:DUF3099 domain-containing protein n=1 Tax=Arthrobacter woluwensis TaxID=156980 RepID=UPI002785B017|nr:DUF3099 domain-containing protein [Arthrobacter woluwensis]MDQ0708911.1 hypothetical protein [Arthrobacter woluwensis]